LDPGKSEWKQLKQLAESTPVHAFLGKSVSADEINLPTSQTIDFEYLTTEDGLVNDTINDIFEDSKGNLWFSTNRGVSKLTIPHVRDAELPEVKKIAEQITDNPEMMKKLHLLAQEKLSNGNVEEAWKVLLSIET
ncbi:MAG: hypothetical protein IIA88_08835, partial [Bacteroidetes bacterium]|nr:hypothetical protein [Bacteroidota bacterium]